MRNSGASGRIWLQCDRPAEAEIYAPEFPTGLEWLNVAFLRMNTLMGRGAVLVEFWDFARVNSLRTMPYLKAWHERYSDAGLRVIGIHSPGYSFGRDRDTVARAVERLEVRYPVLLDPALEVWRLYGNMGWPGRYLFDRTGKLAFIHYGEGEYLETELAIQEHVGEAREPLAPVRPEDAPGVLLEPQTADIVLPADRDRLELVRDWSDGEDWIESADAGAAAGFSFTRRRRRTRCCRAPASSRGSTRRPGRSRQSRRGCGCTGCSSRPRRQRPPDLAREHEAHVLLDDLELRDVVGAARAEEVHQPLHQLLGRARAGADADHPLALQPLLAHLGLVVDQVRVGAVVAGHLDQAVRVGRVARPDHEHQVALARHLADGHLAVGGGVADVVRLRDR